MTKALSRGLGEPKSNPILLIAETLTLDTCGSSGPWFYVSVRLLGGAGGPQISISLFLPTFLFAGGSTERITVMVKMDREIKGTTKI